MTFAPLALPMLAVATLLTAAAAQDSSQDSAPDTPRAKSELRVLYVGDNPESPKIYFADSADARTKQLYSERTPAFTAFLGERFEHVTVVFGDDYTTDLSDAVDVTIFDTRPRALSKAVRGVDPETGQSTYVAATYLPQSFDRPAITISANSPTIGEPLGLKLDWL